MINKLAENFEILEKKLLKSQNVLLVAHLNPDIDSLSSVFSLDYYLRNELKKKTTVLSVDKIDSLSSKLFRKNKLRTIIIYRNMTL